MSETRDADDQVCESCAEAVPRADRPHVEPCIEADLAVGRAARAVERALKDRFHGLGDDGALAADDGDAARARHADPAANAERVKAAARSLGADLAGVCEVDRAWLFPADHGRRTVDLPERYTGAVVMAVAMDAEAIAQSPAPAASAATSAGYMRMAVCSSALAVFIRQCGWSAVASGNDTAVSVPMAVAAGLGEMGLSRMLITPKLGPCLRLCKVFTDMPLATGAPADLGVRKVCEGCGRCVEQCPGEAIPVDWPDPTAPAVDGKKCRDFWRRNGNSCANCLAVCPFMKS